MLLLCLLKRRKLEEKELQNVRLVNVALQQPNNNSISSILQDTIFILYILILIREYTFLKEIAETEGCFIYLSLPNFSTIVAQFVMEFIISYVSKT